MSILIRLAIYAAIAAAISFAALRAWHGFKDSIAAPYVQAQIAKDQPVIDKANADRDEALKRAENAQSDTASCKAGAERQNAGVKEWQAVAAANLARARKAEDANRAKETERFQMRAELQARAKDATKAATCEGRLAEIDKMLRSEARARANTKAVPAVTK